MSPPSVSPRSRFASRKGSRSCSLALLGLLSAAAVPSSAASFSARPLETSETALLEGRADTAAFDLRAILASNPANAQAHLLLCRVWLSENVAELAVSECQAALENGLAKNSVAQDWTGRALGMQAAHAGMLRGLKLALQVRSAFETAVDLDPHSEAACVDLGEYYTAAPAIVGGGSTRALALAARLQSSLPAVSHRIRAMMAEKSDDLTTAEREFGAEAAVAHTPGALVDLAAFYSRHQQMDKAVATAHEILTRDRRHDANIVEAAGVLSDAHQTQLAAETMRGYLTQGEKSDQAPAFRVWTMLGSLLAQAGDRAAARADFQQALALASHYAPAQKGLGAL